MKLVTIKQFSLTQVVAYFFYAALIIVTYFLRGRINFTCCGFCSGSQRTLQKPVRFAYYAEKLSATCLEMQHRYGLAAAPLVQKQFLPLDILYI